MHRTTIFTRIAGWWPWWAWATVVATVLAVVSYVSVPLLVLRPGSQLSTHSIRSAAVSFGAWNCRPAMASVLIDRVIAGMERKAAGGQWTHGPRPRLPCPPRTHRLIPHPDEQHVVEQIFTLYAHARLGTRAIAEQLNQHGKRTRAGKPWSGYTIGRMLANGSTSAKSASATPLPRRG